MRHELGTLYISDSESDFEPNDCCVDQTTSDEDYVSHESSSEEDCYSDNEKEDVSWMLSSAVESTSEVRDDGVQRSKRVRFQQRPL